MFNAVSTTGWNDPELLKEWRRAWTEKVNGKFRECHMAARIDHRSYKEQGIELIPTIHLEENSKAEQQQVNQSEQKPEKKTSILRKLDKKKKECAERDAKQQAVKKKRNYDMSL